MKKKILVCYCNFLSHNSSDTPGRAPLMNVLFWVRCDFPISFSGRDMQRNVWGRLWGSSMVGTGTLSNNTRPPSPECYTTFWMMTIYSDTLHWSGITPIFDRITDIDPITEFDFLPYYERFPKNIWNGCGMPTEDAYSSGQLILSHIGTYKCSHVETNLSWTCLVSRLLSFEHPSVLLLFACKVYSSRYDMMSDGTWSWRGAQGFRRWLVIGRSLVWTLFANEGSGVSETTDLKCCRVSE